MSAKELVETASPQQSFDEAVTVGRPDAGKGSQVDKNYDVVVVGGGAAGLSGALTLARARRSVLVVDEGTPRNALAEGVHNYLGRDGTPPAELTAAGRAEVAGYGGTLVPGRVIAAHRAGASSSLSTTARRWHRDGCW